MAIDPTASDEQNQVQPIGISNRALYGSGLTSNDIIDPTNLSMMEYHLLEFSDTWGYTSYQSVPVTIIDVPEVKVIEAEFVYNFYTRDERTNGSDTYGVINLADPDPYDQMLMRKDKMPRYNIITVTPTTFETVDPVLEGMVPGLGSSPIRDNLDSLQSEDAVATAYFCSFHMKDDFVDRQFYDALSSSVSFFKMSTGAAASPDQVGAVIVMNMTASVAFSPEGQQVRQAMTSPQSLGVSYAPTDTRKEISKNAFNSVTDIDWSNSINNRFVNYIVQGSVEDKTSIYENELFGLLEQSKEIQTKAIEFSVPGIISADEYALRLNALNEVVVDSNSTTPAVELNENSYPIGFIVEKYEIVTDPETSSWERIRHDDIIVEGYNTTQVVDPKIRYGGTYIYNVKTVCLTRFEAFREDSVDDVEDQVVMATVLMASAGYPVKVDCLENIPPNPPQNLRFQWDYASDCLLIFWEEELNPQRDVVRYQIFRRKSVRVPFTIIRELDFDLSTSKAIPREKTPPDLITSVPGPVKFYRDTTFTKESSYIYTLASIDARGLTSNYSAQFKVTFNQAKNKIKTELISQSNAPKPYPNIYLNQDLFVDTMKDSGHTRMRVFFDPEYYDVAKVVENSPALVALGGPATVDESLNFIASQYKIQIMNVDNQLSQVINIDITNDTGPQQDIPINPLTKGTFKS